MQKYQELAEKIPQWYHFPVYQSIWFGGVEIVKGGRDNMFPRMEKIRKEDIKDKMVVDIGCNLGASSFWAIENGAKKCLGFDVVLEAKEFSNRLAKELKVDCVFDLADYSKPQDKKGDIAFVFACHEDIGDYDALLDNLKKYDIIYFETHLKHSFDKWDMPQQIKDYFKCEYLGETGEDNLKRDFYRLTI